MVICQSDDHDRTDDDLTIYNDGTFFDGVDTENSSLGKIDTI